MKIPIYQIGDKVWLLEENKVEEKTVTGVVLTEGIIKYVVGRTSWSHGVYDFQMEEENRLFQSKEKLIESL